jgi:predicted metal-dependent peptidase
MASKNNWDKMSLDQRLSAAGVDIMRHPEFCLLSSFVCMGKIHIVDDMPTAATNGSDEFYGREFMLAQSMKQVRWVRLHENFHKALKHCITYDDLCRKYPNESNMAMDFVINLMIREMDPNEDFAEQPDIQLCYDEDFKGMSFIEVLRILLQEKGRGKSQGQGQGQGSSGKARPKPFDEHKRADKASGRDPKDVEKDERIVADGLENGKMIAKRMAGNKSLGAELTKTAAQRDTDWRNALRLVFTEIVQGDENSRFCPPNKRILPLGFIMPSHFSEATGEVIIAGDTSGSMGSIYPVLFGEVAQICKTAQPERVRVLWWDTEVCGEQVFTRDNYDELTTLLKPAGGGGTSPSAVVRYISEKNLKPKAIVWLTDGYLDGSPTHTSVTQVWGVIDNESFVPPQGKVIHINSLTN